jgi:hypothetical protein
LDLVLYNVPRLDAAHHQLKPTKPVTAFIADIWRSCRRAHALVTAAGEVLTVN